VKPQPPMEFQQSRLACSGAHALMQPIFVESILGAGQLTLFYKIRQNKYIFNQIYLTWSDGTTVLKVLLASLRVMHTRYDIKRKLPFHNFAKS
jgi:hypothetical protein